MTITNDNNNYFNNNNSLLQSSHKQHLMLLYDDETERSSAEIECINYALNQSQYYCVYATVDANDKDFVSKKLVPNITNYDRHAKEGNFLLINFKPFYESAANGDLTPFKQLKAQVEATLSDRMVLGKSGKALLVADAACHLSNKKQFDKCITLERWWQDTYDEWVTKKNLDITIICAHPSSILKQQSMLEQKNSICYVHSLMLDLSDFIKSTRNIGYHRQQSSEVAPPSSVTASAKRNTKRLRILVLEPDVDTNAMYARYFRSLPVELVDIRNKKRPSGKAMIYDNSILEQDYDMIIIDTHLKNEDGKAISFNIAKEILKEKPHQQIIFTTTSDIDKISFELDSLSLITNNKYPILQKPFAFSELLALMKPARLK